MDDFMHSGRKNSYGRLCLVVCLWLLAMVIPAQAADGIAFRLAYDTATSTYKMYMRPTATPVSGLALTSQVTIKVPHNAGSLFTVTNFASQIGSWTPASSVTRAPAEDPGYDYISFDLSSFGITNFGFSANVEQQVFSFKNSGACSGGASIMEDADPYNIPANGTPGNEISLLLPWAGANPGDNLFLGSYGGQAKCQGIEYRLNYDQTSGNYEVYMRPNATPTPSIVLTSQVTVKVPHNAGSLFTVSNYNDLIGTWGGVSSIERAPVEAPGYDYISFSLSSLGTNFNFVSGVEQKIFTFKNSGTCDGAATIMEDSDPFNIANNSAGTHPGNEIGVLPWTGINPGDNDYIGSYGGLAKCQGVEYRLAYNNTSNLYEVYMRATTTPVPSQVLTSQVTVKVPHNNASPFTVSGFTNAIGTWNPASSIERAPTEAPGYDYLSFDLTTIGTNFNFVAGIEQKVFSFANSGACTGLATIMDSNDPFNVQPNSAGTNPGNQINLLAWDGQNPDDNDFLRGYGGAASCPPDVTLSAAPLSVTEGGSTMVTATLAFATTQNVTVNLAYTNGTASASDYSASPASITIPAGSTSATATVATTQDTLDENNETFQIGVASVVNGNNAATPQTITITDDDPMPTVTLGATASVTEGGSATVTATLNTASGLPVTVNLAYANGTASASDYTASPVSITIPAGQTSANVSVATIQDTLDEANETFTVTISSAVNATNMATAQTITIVDDDPTPSVRLSSSLQATEGASATVTATLDGATWQPVTVNLTYTNISASASDYIASPTSITIPAGSLSASISVATVQDTLFELTELFQVAVSSVVNANNASTFETIAINDDDPMPTLTLSATPSVTEGGNITVTASLNTVSGVAAIANLGYVDGTATVTNDYLASPTSITIPAGQLSASVTVATVQDLIPESTETFQIKVVSATLATNGASPQTVTILDDDVVSGYTVPIRIFLQGAFDPTFVKMRADLRTLANFPLSQPYTALGYTHTGGGGAEATTAAVLGNADPYDAIVDWVVVELRSTTTTAVASKAALVQRDGDVVSAADGVSSLNFTGLPSTQYYVVVLHRNHLGAMTASKVTLSASTPLINFTTMTDSQTYGTNGQVSLGGGYRGLWAGDANRSRTVIASGPGTDLTPPIYAVLSAAGNPTLDVNYIVNGYNLNDLNLDGKVIAVGPNNDLGVVQANILAHPLNSAGRANYIIGGTYP